MFRNILVANDGSPVAQRALQEAIRLAAQQGAALTVLAVVNFDAAVADMQMANEQLFERHLESLHADARRILARAAADAAAAGVTARILLRDARSARAGAAIAEESRAGYDLVVLGTHGRRGWNRVLLGSDAEQVLRSAATPVLVVRGGPG
jgi:nucleotide-binding universal stress UspA family protein